MLAQEAGTSGNFSPDGTCGGRHGGWKAGNHETMLKACDKDGDGKLSDQEKAEARTAMQSEWLDKMFAEFDTNGDGKISVEEATARFENLSAKWKGKTEFESKLSEQEKTSMKSVATKWIQEMISKFDKDGDGQISKDEFVAGMKVARENAMEMHKQHHQQKEVSE